jgi:hypothetical protein
LDAAAVLVGLAVAEIIRVLVRVERGGTVGSVGAGVVVDVRVVEVVVDFVVVGGGTTTVTVEVASGVVVGGLVVVREVVTGGGVVKGLQSSD